MKNSQRTTDNGQQFFYINFYSLPDYNAVDLKIIKNC